MNAQQILDALVANLPLIIAVASLTGLLGYVAGNIRRGVVEARKAAAATPSKLDDVLVDILDGPLLKVADLIQRGDVEGGVALVNEVRGTLKAGKLPGLGNVRTLR